MIREIPEVRWWVLKTQEPGPADSRWAESPPSATQIRVVPFGDRRGRERGPLRGLFQLFHEWAKGGRIIRWIRRRDVAVVIVSGWAESGSWRIVRWCHRRGIPCLLTADSNIRSDFARGAKGRLKKWLVGALMRRCAVLLPFGTLGKAFFEKYGGDPGRMFFFPLEPDYRLIREIPAAAVRSAMDRFALRPGRRRIVYSGRLVAVKRVDLLLDGFAAIADRRPQWDLLVVGDGADRAALEGRLPQPLRGRITWTGHLDDQPLVGALYRSSDVLVLPSDYEPWALVVNEAAAAGLALVTSDVVGATAELVRDGVNGRVFPAGDGPALTQCLLEVTDPEKVERMKAASADVLADWRRRADPIQGLRGALCRAGVLSGLGAASGAAT
jgi:glycosyltransferase involved in cell wall biosynthesis